MSKKQQYIFNLDPKANSILIRYLFMKKGPIQQYEFLLLKKILF